MDNFFIKPLTIFDDCINNVGFKVFGIGGSTSDALSTFGIFDNAWFSIDVESEHGFEIEVTTLNGRDALFNFVSGNWSAFSFLGNEVTEVFRKNSDNIGLLSFVGEKLF